MKRLYGALAALVALAVLAQAASVAYGWFTVLHEVDAGMVFDSGYDGNAGLAAHGIIGVTAVPLLALTLVVVSFFARSVPAGRRWAGAVLGVVVLQVLLAFVAFGAPVVGALHGANALVLLAVALKAVSLTRTKDEGRAHVAEVRQPGAAHPS